MLFDYSYLPEILRNYVKDISERMQCPPDFPAIAILTMVAAIIGRKVAVRPKCKDDWTIVPNLWGLIIGPSGIKKSPALKAALLPIQRLQSECYEEYMKLEAEYETQVEYIKLQQSVKKNEVKKKLRNNQCIDPKELTSNHQYLNKPVMQRYITNNATYEKLGEILTENPNGVLVEYDEIIGLLKQLDSYGQEVARSFYLSGANGDTSCTFDRIGRGTLHIPAVCLSIIGGIQPGVLSDYIRQAVTGGAGADGLLQRFSLMVYPDISKDYEYIDRLPDNQAREALNSLIENLNNINPTSIGAQTPLYHKLPFLHFDDEAQEIYVEWAAQLDIRLRSGDEHPAIISHLSKYHKLIPSLALLFHLCEQQSGEITKSALQRSINMANYLESHALRIYSYVSRPEIEAAKTLLKKLHNGKLDSSFKSRDVSQKRWAGLETAEKADSAINVLVEYGHLRREEIKKDTGRPTCIFFWIKE